MNSSQRKAQSKSLRTFIASKRHLHRPFPRSSALPVVLTIAGSDCSGGAGIQADLKTFTTLGTYGASAITSIVAEHPGRVHSIAPVLPRFVIDQIRLVVEAFPVAAIKTGMLYSREIILGVARELRSHKTAIPLVIDPVMVASSGAPLLQPEAISVLKKALLPLAALVTPNRDEAALLWGKPIPDLKTLEAAGRDLFQQYGVPFLLKGGHLGGQQAVDLLCTQDQVRVYRTKFERGGSPHGTGCTLSAAIAASLAQGMPLEEAVGAGKKFITHAIRTRLKMGRFAVLNQLP